LTWNKAVEGSDFNSQVRQDEVACPLVYREDVLGQSTLPHSGYGMTLFADGTGGRNFIIFNLGLIFQIPYIAHKFSPEDLMMIKRVEAAAQYEVTSAVMSFADAHPDARVKIFPLSDVVANITGASPANGFENISAQYGPDAFTVNQFMDAVPQTWSYSLKNKMSHV
jgi:prepilin-type processing-associated H-X9-DG protein